MKIKTLITTFCILLSHFIFAQKLITKTGQVKFLASVPTAVEEVAATNNSVSAVLDTATGDVASQALIEAFKFKVPLMEEHFNENYLESDKYPKATFKGKIDGLDISKLTANPSNYNVEGDFTMHGVTKHLKITAAVAKVNNKIVVNSTFTIKAEDYNIKIPSLVKQKVATDIKVWVDFSF
jgi:polyisoprenoid-binding protein YceI